MSRPPRFTRSLLGLILPRGIRGEAVRGDLEEEYRDRVDRDGRQQAAWWFRRQAWRVIGLYALPWARTRARARIRSPSEAASRSNLLESLIQDLRYGVRQLLRSPGISVVVVVALALGIGANTAAFSAVDAVLLRPLPFVNPDRIVQLIERRTSFPEQAEVQLPLPNFADYEEATSFSRVAALRPNQVNVHQGDRRPTTPAVHFSSALFDMMGVRPVLGRGFLPEEDLEDPEPVVILSHSYWQNEFGGDSTVLGRTVTITRFVQGEGYLPLTLEIVGVMPDGFRIPAIRIRDDYRVWGEGDLFLPMGVWTWGRGNRGMYALRAVAELAPGVSVDAANAEVAAIASGIAESDPDRSAGLSAAVLSLNEIRRARHGTVLALLWAASGLILLVVCANVASLLLGRALARARELSVRTSLGASRGRLLRQLFVESIVLGGTGAVAGLVVAHWGATLLKRLMPGNVHGLAGAGIDLQVLLFAASASLLTIVLFGLGPAVRGTRTHPADSLRSGGRGGIAAGLRPMRWLVVGQVGMSMALLVGSGLLIRSLSSLLDVDPGFDVESTLRIELSPPPPFVRAMQNEERVALHDQIRQRVGAIPGVHSVGAGRINLLSGVRSSGADMTPADGMPPGGRVEVEWIGVLPGFLEAVGSSIVRGRDFDEEDLRRELNGDVDLWGGRAALVNQAAAEQFWPGTDPIERRFYWGVQDPEIVSATMPSWRSGDPYPEGWDDRYPPPIPLVVVGVVADMLSVNLSEEAPPTFYTLNPFAAFTTWVRVTGDPQAMLPSVRAAIEGVDPDIGIASAQAMSAAVRIATADTRFQAVMLTLFAGLAVFMTGLGLFGVLAYAVSRRTHEMAVRMSLGARREQVSRMIIRDGLLLGVPGVLVGLAVTALSTRFLSSLLFGVSAADPMTLAGSAGLVLTVVLAASWWPASRATSVQPMDALRGE